MDASSSASGRRYCRRSVFPLNFWIVVNAFFWVSSTTTVVASSTSAAATAAAATTTTSGGGGSTNTVACLKPIIKTFIDDNRHHNNKKVGFLDLLLQEERYSTYYSNKPNLFLHSTSSSNNNNCWNSSSIVGSNSNSNSNNSNYVENYDDRDGRRLLGHNENKNNIIEDDDGLVYIVDDVDEAHMKLNKLIGQIKSIISDSNSRIMIRNMTPSIVTALSSLTIILNEDSATTTSKSKRSKYAAEFVDLSGVWKPIITTQFKNTFEDYLMNCSIGYFHRKLLLGGIHHQTHHVSQNGENLTLIDKTSPGGFKFDRTLVSFKNVTIQDPNGDLLEVESWWENYGQIHKSLLRGKPSLEGVIETSRYLEEDASVKGGNSDNILISESIFHPFDDSSSSSSSYKYAEIVFRFQRVE